MIGSGAQGAVYRNAGTQTVTKRFFKRSDLLHEVYILSKLNHAPHISKMIDYNEDTNCLIMQDGGETLFDLRDVLHDNWIDIIGRVMIATSSLHERMIVHGDIKLENVLVDEFGNVRLCDFGHARILQQHEIYKPTLKTLRGSPAYTAPEILNGQPYNGFRSDVWSIGILLFAFVMNFFPFTLAQTGYKEYDLFVDLIVNVKMSPADALLHLWSGTIPDMKVKATSLFSKTLNHLLHPHPEERSIFMV